jgi:hypothetical protein
VCVFFSTRSQKPEARSEKCTARSARSSNPIGGAAPAPAPAAPCAARCTALLLLLLWTAGRRPAPRPACAGLVRQRVFRVVRQDPLATPGNFGGGGGGSTGPGHIFLGITRAPPSPPGRGRVQSPMRRSG